MLKWLKIHKENCPVGTENIELGRLEKNWHETASAENLHANQVAACNMQHSRPQIVTAHAIRMLNILCSKPYKFIEAHSAAIDTIWIHKDSENHAHKPSAFI